MTTLLIAVDYPTNTNFENHLIEKYEESIQSLRDRRTNDFRDSGFDLFNPNNIVVDKNIDKQVVLDHGVKVAAFSSDTKKPLPVFLYPRSSISKTPLRMANSVGIIDSGYRGNLLAKLDVHPHLFSDQVYKFNNNSLTNEHVFLLSRDSKYFQICTHNLLPFDDVILVNKNDPRMLANVSERGTGGFGSTSESTTSCSNLDTFSSG